MSRLIDADALIDGLKECKNNKGLIEKLVSSFVFEVVIPYVEQQPTAYDVDKVVEQLEEKADEAHNGYNPVVAFTIKNAIEIVKAGGTDGRIH